MSDINPLGASTYYGGLQNATSQAARELKKEKTSSTAQVAFSKLVQNSRQSEEQKTLEAQGLPPQIAGMSIEDSCPQASARSPVPVRLSGGCADPHVRGSRAAARRSRPPGTCDAAAPLPTVRRSFWAVRTDPVFGSCRSARRQSRYPRSRRK